MTHIQLFAVDDSGPRHLPVADGAAQFTDLYHGLALGVYTALRTFDHNKFLFLDHHLDRTERSMALLGWNYQLDRRRLSTTLHEIVTSSPQAEMRVRIDVLAEPATALGTSSRELIAIQPFNPPPPALYETGVAVAFAAGLARENPLAKTAAFAEMRPDSAGLTQLSGGGGAAGTPYEYLLLDTDGRILEGTGTNFWAVRDGVVYTAGAGVLEGITREIILRLLDELQIPVRLAAISTADIPHLQEAALSGSSRAFLPVVDIAGQTVGDGVPGPVARRVLAAYQQFVASHIRTAVEY